MKCGYKCNPQLYQDYYLNQVGRGLPVYRGYVGQRGGGLGSVLGGLFRSAVPLLKSGGKQLLKHGAKAGLKVLDDVMSGQSIASSAKKRAKESGLNLLKQVVGSGGRQSKIKRRSPKTKAHTRPRRARGRRGVEDIFD